MNLEQIDLDKLPPALKVVANVSTAHLTPEDAWLLEAATGYEAYGFIGRHEYGYFMETWPEECDDEAAESGYSEALLQLINALHTLKIYYVGFDRDAEILEGFETFEW
jgi:hypothetical protein